MSHFGPIAYEDMALLNAQWQQARPAVHGLGAYNPARDRDALLYKYLLAWTRNPSDTVAQSALEAQYLYKWRGATMGASPDQYDLALDQAFQVWLGNKGAFRRMNALHAAAAEWLAHQGLPAVSGLGAFFGQHEYRDVSYLNARLRPILPAEVGMPPLSTAGPGWGDGSLSGNSLGVVTLPEITVYGDPGAQPSVFGGGGGTNWLLVGGAVAAIAVGGALIFRASKKR